MELFLPKKEYLYDDEIQLLLSQIEKNPHLYIEHIEQLKKYDSRPFYNKKLKVAIKSLEANLQPAKPEIDWFANLQPAKPEPVDFSDFRYANPEAAKPEIDWFANLQPAKPEPVDFSEFSDFRYANPEAAKPEAANPEAHVQKIDTHLLKRRSIRDPKLAMDLLHQNPIHMNLIDPSIYTEEMVRLALKIDDLRLLILIDVVTKPTVIKNVLKDFLQIPNVCEYIDLNAYLTEELLYQLGYRSHFEIEKIPIRDTVYIHALCHGELIGPYEIPKGTITRYSSIPLGVCESYSSMTMATIRRTTTYENFLENHQINMLELMKRTNVNTQSPRYDAVRHLTSVPKKTFNQGEEIMNKWFSSLDKIGDFCINFLDIVTPSGKYNLFSIKPEWQLAEIVDMFKDKNIILCDYSCSNKNKHVKDLPLDRYGGTKKKRRKRTRKN